MPPGRIAGRLHYDSFAEIAAKLGIHEANAARIYHRACNKLQQLPEAFDVLTAACRVTRWDHQCPISCASVECNREFISLYAEE